MWQHDSPLEHQFDEVIFNCKKAYYEKQRELDKLREERKELVVKEKEERGRLEDKFINLIKERGKRIAFYFIEQFQNFKKKQKKKGYHQTFKKWLKLRHFEPPTHCMGGDIVEIILFFIFKKRKIQNL